MKNFILTAFFAIIVASLPILIYTLNRPQDLRQQAATTPSGPTPVPTIAGCPPTNHDNSLNVCRANFNCEIGEIEKPDGNNQCTEQLKRPSVCCNIR